MQKEKDEIKIQELNRFKLYKEKAGLNLIIKSHRLFMLIIYNLEE